MIDNKAEKYYMTSPYTYAVNNPTLVIDPDGNDIIIGSNTSETITLLSQLAATNEGAKRVNKLIASKNKYYTQSVFWSNNSAYDTYGEWGTPGTIYHPVSVWLPYLQKGARTSLNVTGHELDHAYRHETGSNMKDKETLEEQAVNFGNYIRSVYDEGSMRKGYAGQGFYLSFDGDETEYNSTGEKVSDFTQINELSYCGSSIYGFSYNKSEKGKDDKTYYMLSTKTKSGKFIYAKYDSKEKYEEVLKYINEQKKKKEDEDK